MTLIVIIWFICGVIAVWREYHGFLKSWYIQFRESYWDYKKGGGITVIRLVLILSPITIAGGLLSLILVETDLPTSWWFTTKGKV